MLQRLICPRCKRDAMMITEFEPEDNAGEAVALCEKCIDQHVEYIKQFKRIA